MARSPKPWFRKQTGWWMVTLGGKQRNLAEGRENKKLAEKKFHELALLVAEAPESGDVRVVSLCDAYLQWCERHRAPETCRGFSFYLQKFSEACGFHRVEDLQPFHITAWLDGEANWGPTTQFNAFRAAHRVFNWAVEQKYITKNPMQGMRQPKPNSRKTVSVLRNAC